jgi:DNA topoisomerase-1
MGTKNLVIVESPAKAKTIEKYLGKDFTVKSSFGHIRDLPKKGLSVDKEKDFHPTYEIPADKKKVVAELRKAAKGAEVWLASDEDREGEAIAWHLCEALKLDPKKTKRIVFHEITKTAILKAIETPRHVDLNLVDAQQARRVLDRLVGYELSPVLWKKVQAGLSAGRVQSVAVRLIVDREREIRDFGATSTYKVTALFTIDKQELKAELVDKLPDYETAKKFVEDCVGAAFTVTGIETKPGSRNPGAPFTTSTLQQEASRRLGYSVRQTMTLAQRLYENGHITYMRTDSMNLSQFAIEGIQEYVTKEFGANYHQRRQFKTKSDSAQEAHEAIRPTQFAVQHAGADAQQKKLYQLIWQRAVASQMSPAKLDRTEVTINASTRTERFMAKGEMLVFDGFLKVYGGGKDDTILPKVEQGQTLPLDTLTAQETFSRPPARYSEAALVKKLEEMGIGRPSTYAPTISTIQNRGYVEKGDLEGQERQIKLVTLIKDNVEEKAETERFGADKNKLMPTPVAEITTDFLVKYFAPIVDFAFTADVEKEFDEIADGKKDWNDMIARFYKEEFAPLIVSSADVTRGETSKMRELGIDPKTKKPVFARFGRYGPMLQLGEAEDEEKPHFAPLPDGALLDTVTLEDALKMFDLPRTVGKTEEGEDILANVGRFGPYVQVGKKYTSIKGLDPRTITEAEARVAIAEQAATKGKANLKEFKGSDIRVVQGPYGPYVTDGKKNAKIPKDTKPEDLTLEECTALIAAAPARKKRVFKARKK